MKIYTKAGDAGKTSLIGGVRISKGSEQIETYGTIDELNCATGVALEMLRGLKLDGENAAQRDGMVAHLRDLQNRLFTMGSILATEVGRWDQYWKPDDLAAWTAEVESLIDDYTAQLPELKGFVMPSGTLTGAQLHVCRTICRRGERMLCRFGQEGGPSGPVFEGVMRFVNRMSDFFFILARKAIQIEGAEETIWKSAK
jgi:cob(I)alamin adenosyltransferase